MRVLCLLLFFACQNQVELPAQALTATEVLQRSVDHHDPGGLWPTFNAGFQLNNDTIIIDLPGQYFAQIGSGKYAVTDRTVCRYDDLVDAARLGSDSCATVRRKRDYHTYLNGLPMKLQDVGTPLEAEVRTKEFHGKEYKVLTVNYPKENNTVESWEFFLDPETYALGAYQFYRSDKPEGGEYLLLEGEIEIGGINMVERKMWYLRENDKLLGTDVVGGEVTAERP